MSIKLQKIIRFVPFVNFFVSYFALIKAGCKRPHRMAESFKILVLMVVSLLLVNLPQMILPNFVTDARFNLILSVVSAYVTLFVLSSIAISRQEKYILDDKIERYMMVSRAKSRYQNPTQRRQERQRETKSYHTNTSSKTTSKKKFPLPLKILIGIICGIICVPIVFNIILFLVFLIREYIQII